MANLDRPRAAAPVDLAVEDQAAADPAADRDVEQRGEPDARPEPGLAQPGGVGVVVQDDARDPGRLAEPVGQREAVPPLDLVREDHDPAGGIDRAAEPDPGRRDPVALGLGAVEQHSERLRDLRPQALGPAQWIDRPPFQSEEPAVAAAQAELKLRAADLDAQQQ
jgi:hypothetical protein